MNEKDIIIEIDEKIEEIVRRNLDEKAEEYTETVTSCEDCRYYERFWSWGSRLHCCAYFSNEPKPKEERKDPITSRDINKIYEQCPINHQVKRRRTYIKRYGIVHHKADRYYDGSFTVVDFIGTRFEDDGRNPDVEKRPIAQFYYEKGEKKEYERAKQMALDYYNKFNLDAEYTKKICWG